MCPPAPNKSTEGGRGAWEEETGLKLKTTKGFWWSVFQALSERILGALVSLETMFKIKLVTHVFKITRFQEYYGVLQSITEYYRLLQSITEYYRVLQSITEYYRVLQSIAEY